MRNFLVRLINARYSLPAWLWVFMSFAIAVIVDYYAFAHPYDEEVQPFLQALPWEGKVWAPLLTAAAVSSMIGMAGNRKWPLRVGAFLSFLLWIFGTIAFYITGAAFSIVLISAPMLIFWTYKYLATYVREFPRL